MLGKMRDPARQALRILAYAKVADRRFSYGDAGPAGTRHIKNALAVIIIVLV